MSSTSLLNLIDGLLRDPAERAAYSDDPAGYLGDKGWGDLSADDIAEAMFAARQGLPAEVAADVPAENDVDGFALLNDVAGIEPINQSETMDDVESNDTPAFGTGAEVEAEAPEAPALDSTDAPAEPGDDPTPGLTDPGELPEVATAEPPPPVADTIDDDGATLPDEPDDWLDPMNP